MTPVLAFTIPVSFLAAVLGGHEGLQSKDGVAWSSLTRKPVSLSLLAGLYRAQWAVESAGYGPFVVTSLYDSPDEHMEKSLHGEGRAADIRTRHVLAPSESNFDSANARKMFHVVGAALGPGFDVLLESDHIHVEHDPRGENVMAAWMGERK